MAQQLGIYNLARPVPSFLGQLGDMQGIEQNDQAIQMNKLAIAERQRQAQQQQTAQQKLDTINQIAKESVGTDGSVDKAKLRTKLTAAGLWSEVPDIEEKLTKVEEAHTKLRKSLSEADASEDERVSAAMALTKASAYSPAPAIEALRGMVGSGAISPQRGQKVLSELQQAQTPEQVKELIDRYVNTSKDQADIAYKQTQTADAAEQRSDRAATRERTAAKTDLEMYSKQLANAAQNDKTGNTYKQAFQGVPAKYRDLFLPPEQFEPTEAARRALEASQTPDQIVVRRETEARNNDLEAKAKADLAERKVNDANLAKARASEARYREWRMKHATTLADPDEKRDNRAYDIYRSEHQRAFSAAMQRYNAVKSSLAGGFDADGKPIEPPVYEPPMEPEEWKASKAKKSSGPSAIPKGLVPGATVTLKNGKKVVVKTVNPDGTFTF